jgi:di/tricarboxylate transporter
MAGLMGVTAFLSMWINNSASANIMIPTAIAIVNELQDYEQAAKQTAVTSENNNYQNVADSGSINSSSKKYLYLHIQIVSQHFSLQLFSRSTHLRMSTHPSTHHCLEI